MVEDTGRQVAVTTVGNGIAGREISVERRIAVSEFFQELD